VKQIAEKAAASIKFLSAELEPFPYSNLEITQIPGLVSQSWPGLIYLSSMAFLDQEDRRALGIRDPYIELLLSRLMLSHETAHQWWGDAVDWISYRDEWIIEAVANYSALLMLEKEDPQSMKIALDYYKNQLLKETGNGIMSDAGPVTLGVRLTSSKFPQAYERVLYGRGTWLIHMLRTMLRQAGGKDNDELFFSALKSLLANSPNHKISTRELQRAFELVLPDSLSYEGRKSLDWFFDTWVNDAAIPQFSLQDVHVVAAGGRVKVSGTIEESHAAKDLVTAVPLYAVNEAGKSQFLAMVFADEAKTQFTLTAPAGTKQILLDPEGTLLRR
jgi:aminopeptidase N